MTVPLWTTYLKSSQKLLRKGRVRTLRSHARRKDWMCGTIWLFSIAPYISASWKHPHISSMGKSGPKTLSLATTKRSNSSSDHPRCVRIHHARCHEPKSWERVWRGGEGAPGERGGGGR